MSQSPEQQLAANIAPFLCWPLLLQPCPASGRLGSSRAASLPSAALLLWLLVRDAFFYLLLPDRGGGGGRAGGRDAPPPHKLHVLTPSTSCFQTEEAAAARAAAELEGVTHRPRISAMARALRPSGDRERLARPRTDKTQVP